MSDPKTISVLTTTSNLPKNTKLQTRSYVYGMDFYMSFSNCFSTDKFSDTDIFAILNNKRSVSDANMKILFGLDSKLLGAIIAINKTLDKPSTKLVLKDILIDNDLSKILILIRISEIYASVIYDEDRYKFFLRDNYKFKRLLNNKKDDSINQLLNVMTELMRKGRGYIETKTNSSNLPYLIFHE